jgi:cytoskeletal protein RodZ
MYEGLVAKSGGYSMIQQLYKNINTNLAVEIGEQLRVARNLKGLSVEAVSKTLLLSSNQIRGIEAGDFNSFYGPDFYVLALKKYTSLLNIPLDFGMIASSGSVSPSMLVSTSVITENKKRGLTDLAQTKFNKTRSFEIIIGNIDKRILIAFVIVVCGFFVFWGYRQNQYRLAEAIIPSQDQEIDSKEDFSAVGASVNSLNESSPKITAETKLAKIDESTSDQLPSAQNAEPPKLSQSASTVQKDTKNITELESIRLEILNPTWIQVMYEDGTKSQKNYAVGESLVLDKSVVHGLVIGDYSAIKGLYGKQPIDFSVYANEGSKVARLFGSRLKAIN